MATFACLSEEGYEAMWALFMQGSKQRKVIERTAPF